MSFNVDEFCSEASKLFEQESHKKYVGAKLPNEGSSIEDISRNGLAQFDRNFERLYNGLVDDEDTTEGMR